MRDIYGRFFLCVFQPDDYKYNVLTVYESLNLKGGNLVG